MIDIFKEIDFTEGRYMINENGDIYSNLSDKILKPYLNNKGYKCIVLRINGQSKKYLIHRLVAMTFLKKVEGKDIVNHIDCNKLNCNVSNLEWCDYSWNNKHAHSLGRHPLTKAQIFARSQPSKHLYKTVHLYDMDWNYIKTFNSITEASDFTGVSKGNISGCCQQRYGCKSAKGFKWSYEIK